MSDTYTVVLGEKGQITVPAELRKKYGLNKGAVILIKDAETNFSLIPGIVVPKYEFDWEKEEKLAELDLKAGRVKRYSSGGYLDELQNRIHEKKETLAIQPSIKKHTIRKTKSSTKKNVVIGKNSESDS